MRPAVHDIQVKTVLAALSVLLPIALWSCQETEADRAGNDAAAEHTPIDARTAASICRAIWSPTAKIKTRGSVLCSVAETINASSAKTFVSLLRANRIDWIVIASLGGDVSSALDMAEAVYDSRASLVVAGPCLSSCANYVFLAARRKYVIPGGIVAWHGGVPERPKGDSDPAAPLIERSRAFTAKIGVNPALFERYPKELDDSPDFIDAVYNDKSPFWTYSKADLENRFSVQGIVDYWLPDCAKWKQEVQKIGMSDLFYAGQCH